MEPIVQWLDRQTCEAAFPPAGRLCAADHPRRQAARAEADGAEPAAVQAAGGLARADAGQVCAGAALRHDRGRGASFP